MKGFTSKLLLLLLLLLLCVPYLLYWLTFIITYVKIGWNLRVNPTMDSGQVGLKFFYKF